MKKIIGIFKFNDLDLKHYFRALYIFYLFIIQEFYDG